MMKQIVDANLDEITLVKNTWTDQFKGAKKLILTKKINYI
jgi:hypothetical protein